MNFTLTFSSTPCSLQPHHNLELHSSLTFCLRKDKHYYCSALIIELINEVLFHCTSMMWLVTWRQKLKGQQLKALLWRVGECQCQKCQEDVVFIRTQCTKFPRLVASSHSCLLMKVAGFLKFCLQLNIDYCVSITCIGINKIKTPLTRTYKTAVLRCSYKWDKSQWLYTNDCSQWPMAV